METYVSACGEIVNANLLHEKCLQLFNDRPSKHVIRLLNEIKLLVNECHIHDDVVNRDEILEFIGFIKLSVEEAVDIRS